jgi:D-tyrosyl-tRNA(Tyr) deacylase
MRAIYPSQMRAVVQRVARAEVRVDGIVLGAIGAGLAILLGVGRGDGTAEADRMAARLARLRVFPDADGRFDRSLLDIGGAALVVSQFTLYGDTSRGNRPSFTEAAAPELAEPLYERVCERLVAEGVRSLERGRFGARMQVELVNDGPVTIVVEL